MGILSRLFKVTEAKTNKVIDEVEDPEIMLDQAIRDEHTKIQDAKESVQKVVATYKQSEALYKREIEGAKLWEAKAQAAVDAGSDELAKEALQRSMEYEKRASDMKASLKTQKKEVDKLKESVSEMERNHNELKRSKDVIIAQHKAAQVRQDVYATKAKIGSHETSDLIDRMRVKADTEKHRADAAQELSEGPDESLEKQFEKIDSKKNLQEVEDKLKKMKKKKGK